MRKQPAGGRQIGGRRGGNRPGGGAQAMGPVERAFSLLERLETGGPNPMNAAEELDRLQPRLSQEGRLEDLLDRVTLLCDAWAEGPLRGERAQAWLVLVGAFGLAEHADAVASVAEDAGLPASLRMQACRTLAGLPGEPACHALTRLVAARTDPQVRAAAAEALAEAGETSALPVLRAQLEEDVPRAVWNALSAAVERLSTRA